MTVYIQPANDQVGWTSPSTYEVSFACEPHVAWIACCVHQSECYLGPGAAPGK